MSFLSTDERRDFEQLKQGISKAGISVKPPKHVTIPEKGGGSLSVVRLTGSVSTTEYTGFLQDKSDPATRADTGAAITCKPIYSDLGGFLETGADAYYHAYEEDGVYWLTTIATFK
jgi:hypothetical protein